MASSVTKARGATAPGRRVGAPVERTRHRAERTTRSRWRDHGLSIVLLAMFVATLGGQVYAGWHAYNQDQRQHGEHQVAMGEYLRTGHFGEATFENWESEFLQMGLFVLLTAFLFQRGSAESKDPDDEEDVDEDPRHASDRSSAPLPVRLGGLALKLYENSLSIVFALLFLLSFLLHGITGLVEVNEERVAHGQSEIALWEYMGDAQFWFESMQNWQSELLSLAAMVILTIFLRQRGSPESKPVAAPYWQTGT
jgi:hypothetical protein